VVAVVIFPTILSFIVNVIIFLHVYALFRRISPVPTISTASSRRQRLAKIPRRDLYLLRHSTFMMILFMGGWGPINVLGMVQLYHRQNFPLAYALLVIWTELCLLGDMINLFIYNHDIRHFMKRLWTNEH
jgi:hypothetical protein